MARFHVGQRVRIKWSVAFPELAGRTGTITGEGEINLPDSPHYGALGWNVQPDGWSSEHGFSTVHDSDCRFCPIEDQLPPATDSYNKTEWKDCLWQPEHLRETA